MSNYKRLGNFNSGLLTNLERGLEPLDKPVLEKQKQEAESYCLDVLSKSSIPNYNLYKFKKCGHTAYLQATHVRSGNFKCDTCFLSGIIESVNKFGDFFVCRTNGTKQVVVRSCGHVFDTHHAHKRTKEISKCFKCFQESLQDLADKNGYKVLDFSGGSWKSVQIKSCGHIRSVHLSQIEKGNIVCRICKDIAHSNIVAEAGLELLSQEPDRYNLYKLPCGCTKTIRKDHAEDGSWLCENCSDSHYTKPSNLYLLQIETKGFTWLKLGFAKNVRLRISNYGLPLDAKVITLVEIPFESGRDAITVEKALHKKYKSLRLDSKLMGNYHTFNGHTECYPLRLKDDLLNDIYLKEKCSD